MIFSLLLACSTNLTIQNDCASSKECYEAFGTGYICEKDSTSKEFGYCTFATATARCTNTTPAGLFDDWENRQNDYLIGSLYTQDSLNYTKSVDMVVESITNVEDRNFTVIHCDYTDDLNGDGLQKEAAVQHGMNFLANELQVPLLIGPYSSEATNMALNDVGETTIISPVATAALLKERTDQFWRPVGSDKTQALVLATLLKNQHQSDNITNSIILYEDEIYSSGLAGEVLNNLESNNITPIHGFYTATSDISNQLQILWSRLPPSTAASQVAILFIGNEVSDINTSLEATLDDGAVYQDATLYFADAAGRDEFLQAINSQQPDPNTTIFGTSPLQNEKGYVYSVFQQSYDSYPATDNRLSPGVAAKYDNLLAENASYNPYSYDAIWMGLYAYSWAHYNGEGATTLPTGKELIAGLRSLSDQTALEAQFIASEWSPDLLSNRQNINVTGATGSLDFDPNTDELNSPIEIWKVNTSTPSNVERQVVDICQSACTSLVDCSLQCCCDSDNLAADFCDTISCEP